MARKRRGEAVHGWLAVDKPAGMTSAAATAAARRLFSAQKVGHGGTLDPLATGILPLAFGEATKTIPYVVDGSKTYTFALVFGERRETDDEEGAVVETSAHRPADEAIEAVLPRFVGMIEQTPPVYSAIKVGGKRAYALARGGASFELRTRKVFIESFRLLERPSRDHACFEVKSGKGAYMRALARDVAQALGTVGHIACLRRCACGPFNQENAISLDKLRALRHSPTLIESLLPVETALDDIPAAAVTEEDARRLSRGLPVDLARAVGFFPDATDGATARVTCGERLVAMARTEGGMIHPVRVFNF